MEWDIVAYDKMLNYQVEISREVEMKLMNNKYTLKANSILDIGCGNGYFTAALADMYPDKKFVAVDSNKELISFAQKHNARDNITYIQAEYSEIKFTELFDVVIARLLVHIIPDRIDFFEWVHSVLKSNGAFFITDADDDNFSIYPNVKMLCLLDQQTNEKINQIGARDTKIIIKKELSSCDFFEERFFTFSPNCIVVDKSIFLKYMLYVMKIEKGEKLPLEAYKELFEWYECDDSFIQYGMYFGLYLKEEKNYEK